MSRKKESVKIIQEEEEIPAEILASAIVKIADSMRAINGTRLTRAAIVALIHDRSKLTKGTIETVLNNLEDLERVWLKKAQR